jgi:hypothetical protein
MPPKAITRMIAIGVNQARMLVCSAVAPVMNGDAYRVVYGLVGGLLEEAHHAFADAARSDGTVEECLDELNDLLAALQHYTPTVLVGFAGAPGNAVTSVAGREGVHARGSA